MKSRFAVLAIVLLQWACASQAPAPTPDPDHERAQRVTITRDDWGIPHVSAQHDEDVVYGVMYAQAEDDFNRVETNVINALGRLAEAEGESAVYRDLRSEEHTSELQSH